MRLSGGGAHPPSSSVLLLLLENCGGGWAAGICAGLIGGKVNEKYVSGEGYKNIPVSEHAKFQPNLFFFEK